MLKNKINRVLQKPRLGEFMGVMSRYYKEKNPDFEPGSVSAVDVRKFYRLHHPFPVISPKPSKDNIKPRIISKPVTSSKGSGKIIKPVRKKQLKRKIKRKKSIIKREKD